MDSQSHNAGSGRANPPETLQERLQAVLERIAQAERSAGRAPGTVRLLAAAKTQPAAAIRTLGAAGQRAVGESYVSEALDKQAALEDLDIEWHFVGPIQSNKTRDVAAAFDWVHSVDRPRIARRLHAQRPETAGPLQVCLQVNSSGEASKSGCDPEELETLARAVMQLPRLRLRGVMAIPAPAADFDAQFAGCRRAAACFESLRSAGYELDTLSLGMSGDLEAAIAAGSTLVRIGTDIFGPRR